jgi:hexulose-6-phosphate isomerase
MFGIMQGRLSKPMSSKIQEFPVNTWANEFELANLLGLQAIEWTLDWNNFRTNPIFISNQQSRIKRLKELYSIEIPSMTLDCFIEAPFYKKNEFTGQKSEIQDLHWIIQNLHNSGIQILVLPIVAESGLFNKTDFLELIKSLNQIDHILSQTNIKIAVECEFNIKSIGNLLCALNPDNFGVNFDMGNSASLGHDPEEELSICRGRILNIHIKDRVLGGKTVKLGIGEVNFKRIAKLLIEQSYAGNMILQAARDPEKNELDTIAHYIEFCSQYDWIKT